MQQSYFSIKFNIIEGQTKLTEFYLRGLINGKNKKIWHRQKKLTFIIIFSLFQTKN